MKAFAQADRFVAEVQARKLRPAYVFAGDEVFFRKRCREAILQHLEDLEDLYLAEAALERIRSGEDRTIPLKEVIKRHGLPS